MQKQIEKDRYNKTSELMDFIKYMDQANMNNTNLMMNTIKDIFKTTKHRTSNKGTKVHQPQSNTTTTEAIMERTIKLIHKQQLN